MVTQDHHYNATLWVMRGPLVMACLRVSTDAAGQVSAASVSELDQGNTTADFDAVLRRKLSERYGETSRLRSSPDAGAGFERFQRERAAGRVPTPPGRPVQPEQKQLDLGDLPAG
jgi:hypothetical protein